MHIGRLTEIFFNTTVAVKVLPVLLGGLRNTVLIALITLVLALAAGLIIAIGRNLRIRWLNLLLIAYIDTFRSLPSLIVIVFTYFALPFIGVRFSPFTAACVSLTFTNAAFFAEIFRSGIEAVGRGQTNAARALGLTGTQTLRWVILPQAVKIIIPPLTGNTVALIKDTTLAAVITVPDLLEEALRSQSAFFNPSPLTAAALVYLAILIPLVRLTGALERWAHASR